MEHPSVTDQASRAWDAVKGGVGFAVHESFKTRQVQNGFADHPWRPFSNRPGRCNECYDRGPALLPKGKHHEHQVPWEKLTDEARQSYIRQGEIPWKMGYLSAQADSGGVVWYDRGYRQGQRDALDRVGIGAASIMGRPVELGTDVVDHPFRPQATGPDLPHVEEPVPVCWFPDPGTGSICGRPQDEHALEATVGG